MALFPLLRFGLPPGVPGRRPGKMHWGMETMSFKPTAAWRSLALAGLLGLGLASGSQAAVLGVYTHNYGTGAYDPQGSDTLHNGYVQVSDTSSERFSDSFDFSGLNAAAIDSLDLTLTYSLAGPSLIPGELWTVRVQGNNPAGLLDDLSVPLLSFLSPQTITLSTLTDFGPVNAFAQSVAQQALTFWFSEWTLGGDNFRLQSASLTVNGTAAPATVPVPAAGALMLAGLGGLAALRRRRQA